MEVNGIRYSYIAVPTSQTHLTERKKKSDWGTLVPRFNVENVMNLGFVRE
jgi:hypothetical protein